MTDSIENQQKEILRCIKYALSKDNVFSSLDESFHDYFHRSCGSMLELRKRNAKNKGALFEVFCKMYLEKKGYTCWMLNELPEDLKEKLKLGKQDVGIDLVARVDQISKKGEPQQLWFAVQCKYRSPGKDGLGRSVHRVTWKDVSTFLSLCTRTGPWTKHIIMTNAESVCWKGHKTSKDYTIARKKFMNCTKLFWCEWIAEKETKIKEEKIQEEEKVPIRNLREKWLQSLTR
jgi:hypothetical protein